MNAYKTKISLKHLQKNQYTLIGLLLSALLLTTVLGIQKTYAQPSNDTPYTCYDGADEVRSCPSASEHNYSIGLCYRVVPRNGGGNDISQIPCPNAGGAQGAGAIPNDCTDGVDAENCGITRYLVLFINALSVTVGVVVATMIVVGGIQYSAARDNPQAAAAAKQRIYNAVLALVTFLFTYAFLQWLVPGGIL